MKMARYLIVPLLFAMSSPGVAAGQEATAQPLTEVESQVLDAQLSAVVLNEGESRDCISSRSATNLAEMPVPQVLQERSSGGLRRNRNLEQNPAILQAITQQQAQWAIESARTQCAAEAEAPDAQP
mgnify:CR=1 FL=1